MLRELNMSEMEETSGGCPPCFGAGLGAGIYIVGNLVSGRPLTIGGFAGATLSGAAGGAAAAVVRNSIAAGSATLSGALTGGANATATSSAASGFLAGQTIGLGRVSSTGSASGGSGWTATRIQRKSN